MSRAHPDSGEGRAVITRGGQPGPRHGSYQLEGMGPTDRLTTTSDAELAIDGPLVGLDRVDRHVELVRDLRVGQRARKVAENGLFALGQRVDQGPPGGELVDGVSGHPLQEIDSESGHRGATLDPLLKTRLQID